MQMKKTCIVDEKKCIIKTLHLMMQMKKAYMYYKKHCT